MIMPEILKSKPILIHLSALILGAFCLGLFKLGVGAELIMIGCAIAWHIAFFSGFFALAAALFDLFHSGDKTLGFRLQLIAVAIMAVLVLACGITFQILTTGRH